MTALASASGAYGSLRLARGTSSLCTSPRADRWIPAAMPALRAVRKTHRPRRPRHRSEAAPSGSVAVRSGGTARTRPARTSVKARSGHRRRDYAADLGLGHVNVNREFVIAELRSRRGYSYHPSRAALPCLVGSMPPDDVRALVSRASTCPDRPEGTGDTVRDRGRLRPARAPPVSTSQSRFVSSRPR